MIGAIYVFKTSIDNDNAQEKIKDGVIKIDEIVTNSEKKLNDAGEALSKNNTLVVDNLKKTIKASEQLQEANEQLQKASEQLQKNYKQIVETLNQTIEGKNATIKAQDEVIGQITGGNSYPELSLKKGGFYLNTHGSFSIPNLKISIWVIPNCLNIPKKVTIDYLRENITDQKYIIPIVAIRYSKLWAGYNIQSIEVENFKSYLPNEDGNMHAFEIYFESDYKKWKQRIRIISHNGKWEIADLLDEIPTTQRDNIFFSEKEIYRHVSENFPSAQSGAWKMIPFFNALPSDSAKLGIIPIEYNDKNGISDYSFDNL
ncbi:hypothetical protein BIW12_04670 [Flavobacterium commune]|uniref:Uncharacterized protein n=2 Tax=Flavobacterium commune TaxID=1306519 RepID=A0A1D9P895_9FLAO|nr:hypothetical protein BIW12_04670 [Flavobacterium commune]